MNYITLSTKERNIHIPTKYILMFQKLLHLINDVLAKLDRLLVRPACGTIFPTRVVGKS